MVQDLIRYDLLIKDAMQKVVGKVLSDVAKDGLPGDHHFFITFKTDAPGVRLSARIREKYPREMVIALQHQFWDLIVTDHYFEVSLSFSGVSEKLTVPFDAMTVFYDPSVQFALSFQPQPVNGEDEDLLPENDSLAPSPLPTKNANGATKLPSPVEMKRPARADDAAKAPVKDKAVKPMTKAKDTKEKKKDAARPDNAETVDNGAEIVQLDAFRKKP